MTGLVYGTVARRETITHINVKNEQARDMMVAKKASVRSFGFLENCFFNYSLNILDLGRVVRDTL